MTDLKPCPFLVRMCSMDGQIIGYTCKGECANCPAEDAKDKEIERLKKQVADREEEGYAGFIIGVEQMKKRLAEKDKEIERLKAALRSVLQNAEFWDNEDDSLAIIHRIATDAIGKDTNVPANAPDTGKMEEK